MQEGQFLAWSTCRRPCGTFDQYGIITAVSSDTFQRIEEFQG
jgi:hypothetical protein